MVVDAWQLASALLLQKENINGHEDDKNYGITHLQQHTESPQQQPKRESWVLECQNHNPDKYVF